MAAQPLKENIFFQSALNYESYLKLMSSLVFILTDEHPEVRDFIVNQGLNQLFFKRAVKLTGPLVAGYVVRDSNEFLAMEYLFKSLTEQASQFEEISQDSSRAQTDRFAQMDAVQNDLQVPSGFPGVDFYLTEIQVQLMFASNFLEQLATQDFYREHLELNFDDKIFFHEPVNKFFDLLWVRKLCF